MLTVSHIIADATTAFTLLRRLVEHAAANGDAVGSRPIIGAPEDLLPARYRARGASPGSLRPDWPRGLPQRWPGRAGSHRSQW